MTIPKHLLESKIITDEQWKEYQELKEYKENATRKHWQQKSAEHYAKEVIYKSRIDKAIPMLKELNIKLKEILKIGIDIKEISDIEEVLQGEDNDKD